MIVLQLVLLQAIIFAALVFILRRVLTRNVTSATSHLQDMIQDYIKKEEALKKRFDEAEVHYHQTVDRARQDAEELKLRLAKEAQETKDKILEAAQKQSEEIVERADRTSGMLKKELTENIEKKAIERACELIQQTLPEQMREETHERWTEELIKDGLEQLGRMHIQNDVTQAQITSAFPLTAKQQDILKKRLKEKTGRDISLKESVDPHIVAGIVVKIGSVLLDGSLFYKIKQAAGSVRPS